MTEFTFDELPKDIQEIIIERKRNFVSEDDQWDYAQLPYYKDQLDENGYNNAKIYYSGFWCQGDGAVFEADINITHFLNKWKDSFWILGIIEPLGYFTFRITGSDNHYSHKHTRHMDWELTGDIMEAVSEELNQFQYNIIVALGGEPFIEKELQRLCEEIETDRKEWCDTIYKGLETEYYYQTSDKCIIEQFRDYGDTFNEKGDFI